MKEYFERAIQSYVGTVEDLLEAFFQEESFIVQILVCITAPLWIVPYEIWKGKK